MLTLKYAFSLYMFTLKVFSYDKSKIKLEIIEWSQLNIVVLKIILWNLYYILKSYYFRITSGLFLCLISIFKMCIPIVL